jgi:hypothetical protein
MRNIAVCIIGRVTGYENNIKSIETFCKSLKAQACQVYFFVSLNTERDEYHEHFEQFLNKLVPDISHTFFYKKYDHEFKSMYNMCSMFWNQQNCSTLIQESGVQFEIVMKWRTEILFENPFKIVSNLMAGTVYIPTNYDWSGLNDQIMYSDTQSAYKYLSLYNHLNDYNKKDVHFHPETLLRYHVQMVGLSVKRFVFPYKLKR